MSMLVWLTLPFYDFCGFRSVAVNSVYKNSSGDEIAKRTFYDDIAPTYFKILKKRTYFV